MGNDHPSNPNIYIPHAIIRLVSNPKAETHPPAANGRKPVATLKEGEKSNDAFSRR